MPLPWPCESWEAMKGEVSNMRPWSVVADPVELEPEVDCAGEGRQRLWAVDQSSGRGGGGRPESAVPRLSDSGAILVVCPRRALCSGEDWPTDDRS
jgi:hypothetical protein